MMDDEYLPDYSVVINLGKFDWPMKEFRTKNAAEIYELQIRTMKPEAAIETKPSSEVRHLQEETVVDEICMGVRV